MPYTVPAGSLGNLAWLFGSPLLADVELLLLVAHRPGQPACSSSPDPHQPAPVATTLAHSLLAHGVVLCQQSSLFKEMIQTFWDSLEHGPVKLTRLQLLVQEGELEAAKLVLKAMYDTTLLLDPGQVQVLSVVQCLRLADCWDAHAVQQSAIQRLEQELAAGRLSWEASCALLELPSLLLSCPALATLYQHIQSDLSEQLGDMERTWSKPDLRSKFLNLPFDVLTSFLSGPTLKVCSENTVFVALTDYIEHGRGRTGLMPSNLRSLLHCIHMGRVSPSFFLSQVLSRPWVQLAAESGPEGGTCPAATPRYLPHQSCRLSPLQQAASEPSSSVSTADMAGGSVPNHCQGGLHQLQPTPHTGGGVLAMCAEYFLARQASTAVAGVDWPSPWMRRSARASPTAPDCGVLTLNVPVHKVLTEAASLGLASVQAPRLRGASDGSWSRHRLKAKRADAISTANLVPSPLLVWGGYVWAMDVFLARDPQLLLGVSVHAVCPAFGLPSAAPAAVRQPSAGPARTPLGGSSISSSVSNDFLASVPQVRTSRASPTRQHATPQPCSVAGSSVGAVGAGCVQPQSPHPPAAGCAHWGVSAKVMLSIWDEALKEWRDVYSQALTTNTGLELLPPSSVPAAQTSASRPDVPRHASRYRVTFTDYYSVLSNEALETLLSSQRGAQSQLGCVRLMARLLEVD